MPHITRAAGNCATSPGQPRKGRPAALAASCCRHGAAMRERGEGPKGLRGCCFISIFPILFQDPLQGHAVCAALCALAANVASRAAAGTAQRQRLRHVVAWCGRWQLQHQGRAHAAKLFHGGPRGATGSAREGFGTHVHSLGVLCTGRAARASAERAACGVANARNSEAIAALCALHTIPILSARCSRDPCRAPQKQKSPGNKEWAVGFCEASGWVVKTFTPSRG